MPKGRGRKALRERKALPGQGKARRKASLGPMRNLCRQEKLGFMEEDFRGFQDGSKHFREDAFILPMKHRVCCMSCLGAGIFYKDIFFGVVLFFFSLFLCKKKPDIAEFIP
jgi:hypothetical protein